MTKYLIPDFGDRMVGYMCIFGLGFLFAMLVF